MSQPGDEYINFIAEDLQTHGEGFVIDDDRKADWALRKIAWADARQRRRGPFVEGEIARLKTWQAHEDARDDQTMAVLQRWLAAYHDRLKASGVLGRRKSYRLPHGVLAARTSDIKWHVDTTKLLAWAEPLGLVRVKKEPAWDTIKARLVPVQDCVGSNAINTTTGEIVPGVIVEQPMREVFQVKADPEGDRDGD